MKIEESFQGNLLFKTMLGGKLMENEHKKNKKNNMLTQIM